MRKNVSQAVTPETLSARHAITKLSQLDMLRLGAVYLETGQKFGFLGFKFGSGKNAGVLQFTQLAKHVQ